MSDKFEKIVNAPHRAFKRAKDKLLAWKIKGENPKVKIKTDSREIELTVPVKQVKQGVKGVGVGLSGIAQFLFWALKYGLLDNHLTRKLEKEFAKIKKTDKAGKEKIWRSFVKKHPNFVGHVAYYIMLLAGAVGVDLSSEESFLKEKTDDFKKLVKEWRMKSDDESDEDDEDVSVEPGTYGEYKARMQRAVPMIVAELIAMEGAVMEGGKHVVYDDATMKPLRPGQKPKGKATQGYGNTVGKDGEGLNSYSPPITSEEAFEWTRWHLEDKETFLFMFGYDVATDAEINTVQDAMAIASMVYNGGTLVLEKESIAMGNRWAEIRKLHEQYGDALTSEQVKAVFEKYPVVSKGHVGEYWLEGGSSEDMANGVGWYINVKKDGDGIRWRRWLEACVMNGDITVQELLDIPVNYMSDFFDYVGRDRSNWFIVTNEGTKRETRVVNQETVAKFKKWIKNPVDKTGKLSLAGKPKVRDVMPPEMVAQCEKDVDLQKGVKSYKKTKRQKKVERETYVISYEEQYAMAIDAYQKQDFELAATRFEELIAEHPDNALLRNDLAATYNRLGRYNDAIVQVREIVNRIGDKSQYGAAQYNAGYAYEQLGDFENAKANYKLAVANGNMRAKKDLERVTRLAGAKKQSGRVAFDDAAARIKSSEDVLDFYMMEQMYQQSNKKA